MKIRPAMLAAIVLIAAPLGLGVPRSRGQDTSACPVVQEVLDDYYGHVKVGTVRSEVEKYFARSGGLQFPGVTRYDYSKFPYFHVDVEYKVTGDIKHPDSPDDKVTKVSKLYVDYQVRD